MNHPIFGGKLGFPGGCPAGKRRNIAIATRLSNGAAGLFPAPVHGELNDKRQDGHDQPRDPDPSVHRPTLA